jgi:hypothetical protein
LRRGTNLTHSRHQRKSSHTWRTLFDEQGATLASVAEILLPHPVSPGQILDEALIALEGAPPQGTPRRASAIRAVAKAAVAHKLRTANPAIETGEPEPPKQRFPGIPCIGMLPWPERAVYFLREALRYSRRDTALLLGMSDANIDQLYLFAQKRIHYSSNPSFAPLPDALDLPSEVRSDHCMAIGF